MAKSLHNYTVVEAQNAALGQAGSILIDDDAQHTGKFVAITAITESVVTTVSEDTSIWDNNTFPELGSIEIADLDDIDSATTIEAWSSQIPANNDAFNTLFGF